MARSSVAAAMRFWLARGGASALSMLGSVLMRSRTCLPSSRARSPRAEASSAIEARSSHTVRYSSASLASSSRERVGVGPSRSAWPSGQACGDPWGRRDLPVSGAHRTGSIGWVVGDDSVALPRGIVTPGAGVAGAAEPVIRSVEETPEHDWVRHAGEVSLRVPVAVGGRQRVEGTQGRLVTR
jgi:hypothetical protein